MDDAVKQDVDRMIAFIYHESKEKIKELEIEARERYNTEKARIIDEKTGILRTEFEEKRKHLRHGKMIELSKVRRQQRVAILREKEHIVDTLFGLVERRLRDTKITKEICRECPEMLEPIVFCRDDDRATVKKYISGELKKIDDEFIGGVVLCSKDGREICDNSFLTRMEVMKQRYMKHISQCIFEREKVSESLESQGKTAESC